MSYVLGIDASTQSCSAIVMDTETGGFIADTSINFGQHLPQYGAPSGFIPNGPKGEVHADPCMWLDALELMMAHLKKQCDMSRIRAISGAGQQHGSVYLNEEWFKKISALSNQQTLAQQIAPCLSRKTSPIWMDTSTTVECQEIAHVVGGNSVVCQKSGSIAIERFTGSQIRRFHKTDPNAYQATARIHLVSSFLCSILCGADVPVDTGDGAGMNLLNLASCEWDPELVNATAPHLLNKLPPVVSGSTQAGTIAPYFVEKFGLQAGTPVVVFTGDNPSSLVGMGASLHGKVVISLGTSDTIFATMPTVVTDPDGYGHVFGNPMGGTMSLQCFVNGSLAREAVKDRLGMDWQQFSEVLGSTPPGNNSNLMLPFFRPEISPRLDIHAPLLVGDETFKNWKNPAAVVRACVEGQALNMKARSAWMKLQPEEIYLTGGASRNNAIAQVIADVFQVKIRRLSISNSVGLGAAIRATIQTKDTDLERLEKVLFRTTPHTVIYPNDTSSIYDEAAKSFAESITLLCSVE